ncbi:WS/DGAT domain-containing protein [Paractinoplanes rishiriensis]|uniref:O-acyltransferase WSD1 C-terminal domain-containing protein n=1 Tax=Paractinoplanes rishiriensis TaxID=1050105 RepID=A0A919K9Z5_9ACTN|nr:WS/DGAT domain-containing protein [Actinoplanes rishiriensis]GIF02183.1 hypothetical protein Ari01nite_96470 [Actinoplanes rishiriensis]
MEYRSPLDASFLPYVPIPEPMRIGVAVMTYAKQAAIGVTTDFAAVPEARDFAAAVAAEMSRLRPARRPTKRAARPA